MEPYSILLDCETLGLSPSAVISEIALIAFRRSDFAVVAEREIRLAVPPQLAAGRTTDAATLQFHRERGTLSPDPGGLLPLEAIDALDRLFTEYPPRVVWIQGPDFDRPLLENFYRMFGRDLPWKYSRSRDCRTAWDLAFPNTRPALNSHRALEDCRATLDHLVTALTTLGRHEAG